LYWQIVELFEIPELKEETDALLLWWEQWVLYSCVLILHFILLCFRQIFPTKSVLRRQNNENLIAKLMAQKRAKVTHHTGLALQNSTNL
jgi:hypothetical protein